MKKRKCELCTKNKARRTCKIYQDKLICSSCCADLRNTACSGCRYFEAATQYHSSKVQESSHKRFIVEVNEVVERKVDSALGLIERGKIREARDILTELKKKHPKNYQVIYGLGVTHAFEGQLDDAINYFTRATDIFPYFIEAHFNKGIAYKKKFDLRNMVKSLKKVIEIGNAQDETVQQAKDLVSSLENEILKNQNINLDDFFEAQDKFEMAFSHMEKGEWQNAISGFKECLNINQNHQQSYGNLGLCYAQLGQRAKAITSLDKALEIDPKYEPARLNKAMIEGLQEGEKPNVKQFQSIEYYKEFPLRKKSLIKSIYEKM